MNLNIRADNGSSIQVSVDLDSELSNLEIENAINSAFQAGCEAYNFKYSSVSEKSDTIKRPMLLGIRDMEVASLIDIFDEPDLKRIKDYERGLTSQDLRDLDDLRQRIVDNWVEVFIALCNVGNEDLNMVLLEELVTEVTGPRYPNIIPDRNN